MKISLRGKISLGLTGSIPRVIVGSTGQASTGYLATLSSLTPGSGSLPAGWTFVRSGNVQVQTSDNTLSLALGNNVPAIASNTRLGTGLELDVSSSIVIASRLLTDFSVGGGASQSLSGLVGPSGDGNSYRVVTTEGVGQNSNYSAVTRPAMKRTGQLWSRSYDGTKLIHRPVLYAGGGYTAMTCKDHNELFFIRSTNWTFSYGQNAGGANPQFIPATSQDVGFRYGLSSQDVCVDYMCYTETAWPIKYPSGGAYGYEQLNVPMVSVSGSAMLRQSFVPKGLPTDYANLFGNAFYLWRIDDNNCLYVTSSTNQWVLVNAGTTVTGTNDVWQLEKPVEVRSMFTPSGSRVEAKFDGSDWFTVISTPIVTSIPWTNNQLNQLFYRSAVHRLYEVETRGGGDVSIKPEVFSFDVSPLSKGPLTSNAFNALGQSRYTCASRDRYVTVDDGASSADEALESVTNVDDVPIGSWGLHIMPSTLNRVVAGASEDILALSVSGVGVSTLTSSVRRPNNTSNAQRVQVNSNGYSNYLSLIGLSNTNRVGSIYIKEGTPGGSYQIADSVGSGIAAIGGAAGSLWKRRVVAPTNSNTYLTLVPVDGRDQSAYGGVTAAARDVLVAHLQMEDGLFPTEFHPAAQTRAASRWYVPAASAAACIPADGRIRFKIRLRPRFLLLNAAGLYSINNYPRLIDMGGTARIFLYGAHGSGTNLAKVGIDLGASSILSTNSYTWPTIADSTTYIEYAIAAGAGTTIIKVKKIDGTIAILENSQTLLGVWPRNVLIDIMQFGASGHFVGGCNLLKFYERDSDLFTGEFA